MVGRSGDLRRIIPPHWEALYGLLGNARMTPYAQERREAGRPVWADMALDGVFLLRRLTRTICASEPTHARRMQRTHELRRSRTRDREGREGAAEGRGYAGFLRLLIRRFSDE